MANSILLGAKKTLHRFVALACLLVAPTASAQVLSAGSHHTCAIDAGEGLRCWGDNRSGQLGDGSIKPRTLPVRVKNLESGVIAVAATSSSRTCALRANGEVLCWGDNSDGQLGDGTTMSRRVPTRVEGLGPGSGVTAIALGGGHACALKSSGAVLCWGSDEFGQIGDGSSRGTRPVTPVAGFGAGSGVAAIAAGESHTCAVKFDQSVYCWGRNDDGGQLGDGTTMSRNVPVPVKTLGVGSGVVSVSTGALHTCATRNDGAVLCWGWNGDGQLGDGSTVQRLVPGFTLRTGIGVSQVNAGFKHTCARVENDAFCWGDNIWGQIGDGTRTERFFPTLVDLSASIDSIAVGSFHSCARKITGAITCWGANHEGQLGAGVDSFSATPQVVLFDEVLFEDGFE